MAKEQLLDLYSSHFAELPEPIQNASNLFLTVTLSPEENPYSALVARCAERLDIPVPNLEIADYGEDFYGSLKHSDEGYAVVLGTSLLRYFTENAIKFVIAHELAHIVVEDTGLQPKLTSIHWFLLYLFLLFISGIKIMGIIHIIPIEIATDLCTVFLPILLGMCTLLFILCARSRYIETHVDSIAASLVGYEVGIDFFRELMAHQPNRNIGWSKYFGTHPSDEVRIKNLEKLQARFR